jgi:hypothetical protein
LFEEVGGRWGCGDGDADGVGEFFGFFGGAEEGVDCGCGIEVGYVFGFQQFPD